MLKVKVGSQYRRIKEIRTTNCWDFSRQGPFSADVALMILNKPLDDVVEGVDYLKLWDSAE